VRKPPVHRSLEFVTAVFLGAVFGRTMARFLLRASLPMNEVQRIIALASAGPVVRLYRDGGRSWDEIAKLKTANPLGLSPRQLSRIYEGEDRYKFDLLRRMAKTSTHAG